MSNYSQITSFTPKDALLSGNPAKLIKGADFDGEFAAIATAIATKIETSNGANPTAIVGLSVINGSAGSYMRSDGSPALSQAIAPTWSSQHIFSKGFTTNGQNADSAVLIKSAAPGFTMVNSSAGADAKTWTLGAQAANELSLYTSSDSGAVTFNILDVIRSGASITSIALGNTTNKPSITLNGPVSIQSAPSSVTALIVNQAASAANAIIVNAASISDVSLQINGIAAGQSAIGFGNATTASMGFIGAAGATGQFIGGSAAGDVCIRSQGGSIRLSVNSGANTNTLLTSAGELQTIDARGNLQAVGWRGLPLNNPGGSYTPVLGDRGQMVAITSGTTITIPNGVFSAGDALSLLIGSGGTATIAQGAGLSLQWANGGASTGNRTITGSAIATVYFFSSSLALISGTGLS